MRRTPAAILFAAIVAAGCTSQVQKSGDVTVVVDVVGDIEEEPTDEGTVEDPGPDEDPGEPDVFIPPFDPGPPPDTGPPPQPQDPLVCSGNVTEPLQDFGGSCCYTPASHPHNANCLSSDETGACLHAQCGTGLCFRPYCSKPCVMGQDAINNDTLEPGSDGINDPEAFNDCAGAVAGPVGTDFQCVSQRAPDSSSPLTRCFAGTTFAACDKNSDCPDGEGCDLMFVQGEYSKRCRTYPEGARDGMEPCTFDPNAGAAIECKGAWCSSSIGCVDGCLTDDDCLTDTCAEGTCAGSGIDCEADTDCSAWQCELLQPFGSDVAYETTVCQPKDCKVAADCPGDGWFCRPFWNGADTIEDVDINHQCRPADAGTVDYGQPCDDDNPCVFDSACIDGHCSGPCLSDADCGENTECLVGFEWDIDVDGDDEIDTYINIDLCRSWEHLGDELVDCSSDADCGDGEHCRYRVKGQGEGPDRVWASEYKCRKDFTEFVDFGDTCNTASGQICASDLCLVPNLLVDNASAFCSSYCQKASDCPDTMGPYEGLYWRTVCQSFLVNRNGSPAQEDDVYVPYCRPTNSTGSLKTCEETRTCTSSKEYCRALAIAGNPDEAVTVEHLCSDASEGLASLGVLEIPKKRVGEPCESWTECVGRRCLPDGSGTSYCSELCLTDADCANDSLDGLQCTEEMLIARADPELSGITRRCVLVQACVPCEDDSDCGGELQCVNIGNIGFTQDYRCGAPCEGDADCGDPGYFCQEDVDADSGLPTGKKACLPDSCDAGEE